MERTAKRAGQHRRNRTLQWCFGATLGAVLVIVLFTVWFAPITMANQSMSPTLNTGDVLLYNRLLKYIRPPARGEMIVFRHPVTREFLIKRVIATGGETLRVEKGRVILGEKYQLNEVGYCLPADFTMSEREVPGGAVFVLSDNRIYDDDSRSGRIGCVFIEDVLGIVQIRVNDFHFFSVRQSKTELF